MLLFSILCCLLPALILGLNPIEQSFINASTAGCSCAGDGVCPITSVQPDTGRSRDGQQREVLRLETNGVPNHAAQQCNGNQPLYRADRKSIKIPLLDATARFFSPARSDEAAAPRYCIPPGNIVGWAHNGVPIYSGKDTVCSSVSPQLSVERVTGPGGSIQLWRFDTCGGHTSFGGQYHYHCIPNCIYPTLSNPQGVDEFIGVAVDGYPIYGPRVGVLGGVASNADLDACHGWNFNDGLGYRYIMNYEFPYSVGCLRGAPYKNKTQECGADQVSGRVYVCETEDGDTGYGGDGGYGDDDDCASSGRYKRGSGRRGRGRGRGRSRGRGGRRRDEKLQARVHSFVDVQPLFNQEECVDTETCSWQAAPQCDDRGDRDRSRGDGEPRVVPVPAAALRDMTNRTRVAARRVMDECRRLIRTIDYRNRHCSGEIPETMETACRDMERDLRGFTRLQDGMNGLQRECERLAQQVGIPTPDETATLPSVCRSRFTGTYGVGSPGREAERQDDTQGDRDNQRREQNDQPDGRGDRQREGRRERQREGRGERQREGRQRGRRRD